MAQSERVIGITRVTFALGTAASTFSLSDLRLVTVVTNVTFAQLTWRTDQETMA